MCLSIRKKVIFDCKKGKKKNLEGKRGGLALCQGVVLELQGFSKRESTKNGGNFYQSQKLFKKKHNVYIKKHNKILFFLCFYVKIMLQNGWVEAAHEMREKMKKHTFF